MSGWIEKKYGDIKIKHHSTSSLIEVIVANEEDGTTETIWFDYKSFSDLKKVINQIKFPS